MTSNGEGIPMTDVVHNLAEAIRDMRFDRPSAIAGMGGSIGINSFFVTLEKYCITVCKKKTQSWLQVLPSFLEGEARSIVHTFRTNTKYHKVKQRLIDEFTNRSTLPGIEFFYFFSATRHLGESWTCFSIRLETLARNVAQAGTPNQGLINF